MEAEGSWHPCGDFGQMTNIMTPERKLLSHIQSLSAHLAGATIFSIGYARDSYHHSLQPFQIPADAFHPHGGNSHVSTP